jgi:hypothetical protein
LPKPKTNTIIKKRKRFPIPIVARVFHKDSDPRKSITDVMLGELLKVVMRKDSWITERLILAYLHLALVWNKPIELSRSIDRDIACLIPTYVYSSSTKMELTIHIS